MRVPPVRERVLSKIVIDPDGPPGPDESPCWNWTGAKFTSGYGRLYIRRNIVLAHRAAWQLLRGPIPPGHRLIRECGNLGCCNPAHLELMPGRYVEGEDYAVRDAAKAQRRTRRRAEACPRGHLWTPENTEPRPEDRRRCRACHREDQRRLRAAKRARKAQP